MWRLIRSYRPALVVSAGLVLLPTFCALAVWAAPLSQSNRSSNRASAGKFPPDELLICPKARVVVFPDTTIGQFVTARTVTVEGVQKIESNAVAAKGKVLIPAHSFTTLDIGSVAVHHPELLDRLPASGIDSLKVRFASMDEAEDTLVDRALDHILQLKSLKSLYLNRSDVSDAALAKLSALSDLRLFEAGGCNFNGAFLRSVTTLKRLRNLRIGGNRLDESNLVYLKELPALKQLSVARCRIGAAGIAHISHCPAIYELDISQNPKIGDSELSGLHALKKLLILDLEGTNVGLKGLAAIRSLPLTQLVLPRARYSDAEMKEIKAFFPHAAIELARHDTKQRAAETEDLNVILGPVTRD